MNSASKPFCFPLAILPSSSFLAGLLGDSVWLWSQSGGPWCCDSDMDPDPFPFLKSLYRQWFSLWALFFAFLELLILYVHTLKCLCRHIILILQPCISLCVLVMSVNKTARALMHCLFTSLSLRAGICAFSLCDVDLINGGSWGFGRPILFIGYKDVMSQFLMDGCMVKWL